MFIYVASNNLVILEDLGFKNKTSDQSLQNYWSYKI